MERWLDRIAQFDFRIVYLPGKDNISPDSRSRNILSRGEDENSMSDQIMNFHIQSVHRKKIKKDLLNKFGMEVTESQLAKILSKCQECCKKDKMVTNQQNF